MKKLSLFLLGVLFFAQGTAALAATTIEPAIHGLLGFNRWLKGNDFSGARYINDNLQQMLFRAQEWDAGASLSYMEVVFPNPSCSFEFASDAKPNEVLSGTCVDVFSVPFEAKVLPLSEAKWKGKGFGFPSKLLRYFVSNIFANPSVLRDVRTAMNQNSSSDVFFTLKKVNGEVRWNWEVVDANKQFGVVVHTDAMNVTSVPEITTK